MVQGFQSENLFLSAIKVQSKAATLRRRHHSRAVMLLASHAPRGSNPDNSGTSRVALLQSADKPWKTELLI